MITFTCPTCESTLIAKDEKLIGKILACPKCGSMVLVQSPDEAPTPQYVVPPTPRIHKRFPDVLTHETGSGVMGPTARDHLRSDLLLADDLPETDVSDTEIKTRMVLVGILIGLLILLLAALGFLMLFRKSTSPKPPPEPQNPVIQVPAEPLPVEPQVEPEPAIPTKETEVSDPPSETKTEPSAPVPTEPVELKESPDEPVPVTDDSLSAFERKMPGLLDTSVPDIDIEAKLALPILELNFEQHNLIDFVKIISHLTGIPFTLHIDEMKPNSLSVKTPVSGHFTESTASAVLTETLASIGLQWIAADRQITILPKKTAEDEDVTFDVADFAERTDDLTPEVLADMVQKLVCPECTLTVSLDQQLTVEQDEENPIMNPESPKSPKRQNVEILRFLEQLRAIRQIPQKTEWSGETLAPEAFGWDSVMKPITLHYYRPVPFARMTEQLESITNLTILVDHQSLHQALCSFATIQITVQCNGGTVNDAMELSLSSVDSAALAYRIIDHQTLEITTAESARRPEKMSVEVHRYHLQEDETPEDIVRSMRQAVEPESWSVADQPETKYGGNIVIDRPSGCLLVRQSQPVQRQIRLYLSAPES